MPVRLSGLGKPIGKAFGILGADATHLVGRHIDAMPWRFRGIGEASAECAISVEDRDRFNLP